MPQCKTILLASFLCANAVFAADIPIESRSLSDTTPPVSAKTANLNWDLLQKNEQLENQLRILRGKIEELENTLDKLNSDVNNRYTDLDQRLDLLKQQLDPNDTTPEASTVNTASSSASDPSTTASSVTAGATTSLTAPNATTATSNSNTETTLADNNIAANILPVAPSTAASTSTPNNNASIDAPKPVQENIIDNNSNNSSTEPPTSRANMPTEQERAAYTVALEAYKNGGAQNAIVPMQDFIRNYPRSAYAGNAHFWLGEFNLATEPVNYNEAKKNYSIVIRQYPDSAKSARALFQLYNISLDVDKNKNLADKYKSQLLKYYPNSEEAKFFNKQK